jgi:hypothetical protein
MDSPDFNSIITLSIEFFEKILHKWYLLTGAGLKPAPTKLMFRNFKVRNIAARQPPESPFSKGDLRKSPLIKGAGGCLCLALQ